MLTLTQLDYFLIGIIVLSAMIGFFRGFLKETFTLLIWFFSLYLAYNYGSEAGKYLINTIQNGSARRTLSFILLFLISFFILSVLTFCVRRIVQLFGMRAVDHMLGFLFGVIRGLILSYGVIVLCQWLGWMQLSGIKGSVLIRELQPKASWAQNQWQQSTGHTFFIQHI